MAPHHAPVPSCDMRRSPLNWNIVVCGENSHRYATFYWTTDTEDSRSLHRSSTTLSGSPTRSRASTEPHLTHHKGRLTCISFTALEGHEFHAPGITCTCFCSSPSHSVKQSIWTEEDAGGVYNGRLRVEQFASSFDEC